MNTLAAANKELRDQLTTYIEKLGNLSVYNRDELFEKGLLLSNLQSVEVTLKETLETLHTKITEQKLIIEKYIREAEESFNAVRQNIYNDFTQNKSSQPLQLQQQLLQPTQVAQQPLQQPYQLFDNTTRPLETCQKSKPTFAEKVKSTSGWTEVGKKALKHIPKTVRREVAPDTFISAITVNTKEECHNHLGWWCWCPSENRFCISINGHVYSGNTTVIHQSNVQPVKFFEHRRSDRVENWQESDYYVPPEKNPESKDIRQFTNKMKFVPASRNLEKYETYAYRLGSKDTLRDDVMCLKPEDYRIFSDLTTNFLLCLTAATVEMDRRV